MSIHTLDTVRTGRPIPMRTVVTIPTIDLSVGMVIGYTFNGTHRANTVIDIDRTDTLTVAWVSDTFGLTITTDTCTVEI